jgi:hypothetical protein
MVVKEQSDQGVQVRSAVGNDEAVGLTLPVGFRALADAGRFELSFRVRDQSSGIITLFTLAWNAFMAVWFTIAISRGEWAMALFGTLHLLVGVGLAYWTLRHLFGKTFILVDSGLLTVRQRPFPVGPATEIKAQEIAQLWVDGDDGLMINGVPVRRYRLQLRKIDGTSVVIVEGLPEHAMAKEIERQIEQHLRIVDDGTGL